MDMETHDLMASALVERGLMTAEAVAADRAQVVAQIESGEGFDPMADTNAKPTGKPVAAQAGNTEANAPVDPLDALAFAPPPSPNVYRMVNGAAPEGATMNLEFQSANRQAMHAAGLPEGIGNALADRWNAAMAQPQPTEAQIELSARKATEVLTKQWGPDFTKNLAIANTVVADMEKHQPAIRQMLKVTGLGNDPWIIASFYNVAKARGRA